MPGETNAVQGLGDAKCWHGVLLSQHCEDCKKHYAGALDKMKNARLICDPRRDLELRRAGV